MVNIEKNNVEIWDGGSVSAPKEYVPIKPKNLEEKKGDDSQNPEILSTEEKLEEAYKETKQPNADETIQNTTNQADNELIQQNIKNLNRPEAEKWIAQSYTNIESTIKESKNEKWIAGFLGKIMNKILS